jgi:16S rRNA (adenine1518-N6/adenine1519-N6)-dimethyltransferase
MKKRMDDETRFEAKKSLGQNFLNNARIPRLMADAASITKDDTVLEIGPGTGMLTRELLLRAGRVIAVETDQRAVTLLEDLFKDEIHRGALTLVLGDVRSYDIATLGLRPQGYKIVANIPYYLSGFLFRTFLEHALQPATIVFLVQKEVAERIARDTKESLLSLSVKVYGEPKYVEAVRKGNFSPQPKVDSAIIAVTNISREHFNTIAETDFFTLIHEGFKSKRKQLLGNMAARYGREPSREALTALRLKESVRAEDIPLEIWLKLTEHLSVHRKATKNTTS